ncbi:asparagine synthase [Streptomyces sp. A7024]|uniref:Asparagine synthase n=1 Tax=Streptomyces coryli TaxID=1128680 RepID=A0A6G4U632_9ACTN|nr:asparagine synthase-related protein [Streptomyces coryli]NGN67699.1 asparagine synthase [Streptomyces coryli]
MRWLVGWSSVGWGAAAGPSFLDDSAHYDLRPVGAQQLWDGPDPLWAVGDWRPDEVRVIQVEPGTRLAVFGSCGASDDELRVGLFAARGGAVRHLTAWPGSYTAVAQTGRRLTVLGDLAGARPVFHTPWEGGTAYATAALPLADLVEAQLDVGHLAAQLACPDSPEALGDRTPYAGVHRLPPGHALTLREGAKQITGYEPRASLAVAAPAVDADAAVTRVREALVAAVRARLAAPRHAPEAEPGLDPGPIPGMGPFERRALRGPAPGLGADLSGGSASGTLALLAAGLPGVPGTPTGLGQGGERLLAVTFNDLAVSGTSAGPAREAELERARDLASNPRLRHVVVAAGEDALPFADLDAGPLTDEPGPSLVMAARHRRRLTSGSADHLVGHGAREVLDAHPARLADLLMDRQRRHLLRPVTALARSQGSARSVLVPFTVYRAARRLARTPYREGLEAAADLLLDDPAELMGAGPDAVQASLAALAWCRPGPAARWLTGEALAEVSVRLRAAAETGTPEGAGRPGERRAAAALARQAADARVLEQAAEVRSQRLHAPFLDNQVVRACRDLPEALRVRPGARAAVLRAVLEGAGIRELPVGWGAGGAAAQGSALRIGLRSSVDQLVALFDRPLLGDAGLVEPRVVRKAIVAAAKAGADVTEEGAGGRDAETALTGLAEIVGTEVWLRKLLSRRGSCWTGADAPTERRAVAEGVPRRLTSLP